MTKNFNIRFENGKYYNLVGKKPNTALSDTYGKRLYNRQYPKIHEAQLLSIRIVNGDYYNDNGKNPNIPLSDSYGKRLYRNQEKYGNKISLKDASGHGKLNSKKEILNKINKKLSAQKTKENVVLLNNTDYQGFLKRISEKSIDTKNMRTRFRSVFRVYHDDNPEYDVISSAKALDGVIPLERFIDNLPNDAFGGNVQGEFRYIIYDKITKQVYHDMNYDVTNT